MRRDFKEGEPSTLPDTVFSKQKEAAVTLSYTEAKRKKRMNCEKTEV